MRCLKSWNLFHFEFRNLVELYRRLALIATQLIKLQICFYRIEALTLCFYIYHVKRYIHNSISFASEGKIITCAAINLALALQQHWLVFSCFVTLQVAYLVSTQPYYVVQMTHEDFFVHFKKPLL